jgi:hypothetical protein
MDDSDRQWDTHQTLSPRPNGRPLSAWSIGAIARATRITEQNAEHVAAEALADVSEKRASSTDYHRYSTDSPR